MMSFDEFFTAVWGYAPHRWQSALADKVVAEGRWPRGIAVPTGMGKTSTIDVWLWSLARDVALHGTDGRTVPLRLCFAVERRLIVDEAAEHALALIAAIETHPELEWMRQALVRLLPEWAQTQSPVSVVSLHGGKSTEQGWWRAAGAMVVTATMTQAISRVLFRGVGESVGQRPISAGLLGTDCLRLVDEPHLSEAAALTLVEQEQMVTGELAVRRPQTVMLGATVPAAVRFVDDRFAPDISVETSPRAHVRRPLELVEVAGETKASVEAAVAEMMASVAQTEHDAGGDVVVIASTTKLASTVAAKAKGKGKAGPATRLVSGRVRPADREGVLLPGTGSVPDGQLPDIVVATQTLEAGVDFDARVIISDLAALPALMQRAGRCNRRGVRPDARVVVVLPERESPIPDGPVKVYGLDQLEATRELLFDRRPAQLDEIDVEAHPQCWPGTVARVPLTETMVELLGNTRSYAPWEKYAWGVSEDASNRSSIRVCWREDPELVSAVAVRTGECVELPLMAVRGALIGAKPVTEDVDATVGVVKPSKELKVTGAFRVSAYGEVSPITDAQQVIGGDTVVLPTSAGFYSPAKGWDLGIKTPVTEVIADLVLAAGAGGVIPLAATGIDVSQAEAFLAGEIDALELPDGWILGDTPGTVVVPGPERGWGAPRPTPVLLADHLDQVGTWAQQAAVAAGLPAEIAESHRQAGLHHDLGKSVSGFQMLLGNPDPGTPWAKSMDRRSRPTSLPQGWRHEAVVAARMGEGLGAWLVASHHGHRDVAVHCGRHQQVTVCPKGASVWDVAAHEALFRWADQQASAMPAADRGLSLDDLGLSMTPGEELLELPVPVQRGDEVIHRLEGLRSSPLGGSLTAYGVLAAVSKTDPEARLRYAADGVFELATTVAELTEELWEPQFAWAPGYVGKDHKWPAAGVEVDDAAIAQLRLLWPSAPPKKKKKPKTPVKAPAAPTVRAAVAVQSCNSRPAQFAQGRSDQIPGLMDVLFDPRAGWCSTVRYLSNPEKCVRAVTGGLDGAVDAISRKVRDQVRPGVLAWAVAGQLALGQAQTIEGAGTQPSAAGTVLFTPRPTEWASLLELRAMAQRGVGVRWHKRKLTQYESVWAVVEE